MAVNLAFLFFLVHFRIVKNLIDQHFLFYAKSVANLLVSWHRAELPGSNLFHFLMCYLTREDAAQVFINFFFTLGLHSQRSFSSQCSFTSLIYRLSVTYASSLTCGFRPFQKDISPSSHIFHLPEKLIHQIPIRPQINGWKSIVDMCHSLIYYGFSLLCTLCSQRSGLLQFVHFKLRMITAFPLRSCLYCAISFCLLFWSSWKVAMWRMSGKKGKL